MIYNQQYHCGQLNNQTSAAMILYYFFDDYKIVGSYL